MNTKRKQAQNKENFEIVFIKYHSMLEQYNIEPRNRWNIDATGYQIGCYKNTEVNVPRHIKSVSYAVHLFGF